MLSFTQFNETFDSTPANFKIDTDKEWLTQYTFEVDNNQFIVKIVYSSFNGTREASFALKKGKDYDFGLTNTGNQFKVLSTVMACLADYIENKNPRSLTFNALKGSDDKSSDSRPKVYTRLLKRRLPKNWIVDYSETNEFVQYRLYRKDVE